MKIILTLIFVINISILPVKAKQRQLITGPDSIISAALTRINQDTLYSYVHSLQNMGTRFMIAQNRKEVAMWLMNKFLSFGITEVRLDSFPAYVNITYPPLLYDTTTWQYNVEAKIEGTELPEQEMIIIGHYDDACLDTDPILLAPGADDNASGTAAVLECARIITEMNYLPKQTIVFLSSAAEELMGYGDSGAEHYAAEVEASGRDIEMVLNNDMIGWNDGTWTIQLINHINSPVLTNLAIDIITNYTTLNYQSLNPAQYIGGDIQPFLDAGYHGIYFMEHAINPNYHSLSDSIDYLDFEYLAEVTGISLGCMLHTDLTLKTKDNNDDLFKLEILPNPASESLIVRTPDSGGFPQNLKIYGIDGKLKLNYIVVNTTTKIDISVLSAGIYLVVLSSDSGVKYNRLVVV